MRPYRILLLLGVIMALALSACGGGRPAETPGPGGPAGGAPGALGGWEKVTVLPGSVDAFAALYFPLSDIRRADIQARFPIIKGKVEGPVEKLGGAPFFRFKLKAGDKTYEVEGIPEASHAPDIFASPVIQEDLEPQADSAVTVMGELKGNQIIANYVAVEGQGVWFYRSYLLNRNVQVELRPEIADLYDGLPIAVKGMINSANPKGEFYEFDASLTISSQYFGRDGLFIGTFRKSSPTPYVEVTGIFVKEGDNYTQVLQ